MTGVTLAELAEPVTISDGREGNGTISVAKQLLRPVQGHWQPSETLKFQQDIQGCHTGQC